MMKIMVNGVSRNAAPAEEAAILAQQEIDSSLPEPDPLPPRPRVVAGAYNVAVADGDIASIEVSGGISAGLYLGAGTYLMFFQVEQADDAYFVRGWSADGNRFGVTYKDAASFMLEARDAAGELADPQSFSVEIVRVN